MTLRIPPPQKKNKIVVCYLECCDFHYHSLFFFSSILCKCLFLNSSINPPNMADGWISPPNDPLPVDPLLTSWFLAMGLAIGSPSWSWLLDWRPLPLMMIHYSPWRFLGFWLWDWWLAHHLGFWLWDWPPVYLMKIHCSPWRLLVFGYGTSGRFAILIFGYGTHTQFSILVFRYGTSS